MSTELCVTLNCSFVFVLLDMSGDHEQCGGEYRAS